MKNHTRKLSESLERRLPICTSMSFQKYDQCCSSWSWLHSWAPHFALKFHSRVRRNLKGEVLSQVMVAAGSLIGSVFFSSETQMKVTGACAPVWSTTWLRLGSCVVNVRTWCRWGYLMCWDKLISFSCSFDPMNLYNNRPVSENYEPVHSLRRPTFVIQKRNSPEGRVIHGASCQSRLRPHHAKIEAPTAASNCWTVTTTNNSAILRTTLFFYVKWEYQLKTSNSSC